MSVAVAARPIAEVLTGFGPDAAVDAAAAALPWMVVAGLGQFTAGLLASTLAALDEYVVPALAFIAGSVAGLTSSSCGSTRTARRQWHGGWR